MIYAVLILSLAGIGLMVWKREWMPYILIFSLPFEIMPATDVAGVTLRVSNILFAASLIMIVIEVLRDRRKLFYKYDWLLVGFLTASLFSLNRVLNIDRWVIFFLSISYVFVVFVVTRYLVSKEKVDKLKIAKAVIYTFVVTCALGLYQFLGQVFGLSGVATFARLPYQIGVFSFPRIESTMYEPLYLANFMVLPIILLLVLIIFDIKLIKRSVLYVLLVLFGTVFILTLSRGGYLAFLVALIVLLILAWKQLKIKKIASLFTAAVLVLGLSYFLVVFSGWYYPKYVLKINQPQRSAAEIFLHHSLETKDVSVTNRTWRNKTALDAWRSSPIIGVGLGNYGPYVVKNFGDSEHYKIVLNVYYELLAETGLVGFSFIIIFWGYIIWMAFQYIIKEKNKNKWIIIASTAALIGILVQWASFSPLYIAHIWFIFGLLAGFLIVGNQELKVKNG